MTGETDSNGHDSFLDIIANLVGILIILVVIVGAQATTVWQASSGQSEAWEEEFEQLESQQQKFATEALSIQKHNAELRQKIRYQRRLNQQLEQNRHAMLVAIEQQKINLDEEISLLTAEQSKTQRIQAEIDMLEQKIEQVRFEFNAVEYAAVPKTETIDHYPTPIAKTVFADEIHFQLSGQKIVYVPMDELLSAMKSEWKVKAKKLSTADNTWETVGPIENFRMQYLLNIVRNPRQPSQYGIQFDRFAMQPVAPNLGEGVEAALANRSDFNQKLARMAPSRTTVTFWVFPDSYDQLQKIRSNLRERGFQTACWPMNFGQSISGGPNGFRTTTN